jgi:AcrR family transcriptional regulator
VNTLQERILDAAYPLITSHGVRGVSLDDVRVGAAVSLAELEASFASMSEIAEACLARREQEWTIDMVESGARKRGTGPEGRVLGVFDVLDDWFRREDYEACLFMNVLLELGREHPLGNESVRYLGRVRAMISDLAEEARLERLDEFALSLHLLMKGAIVGAAEGDVDAALRARRMAEDLIARHRRTELPADPEIDLDWAEWDEAVSDAAPTSRRGAAPNAQVLDWMDLAELEFS